MIRSPELREGGRLPLFLLPSTAGGQSGPGQLRSRYNLVLALLDGSADTEGYLQALSQIYPGVLSEQARLLAVVPFPLDVAAQLATRLKLPFPLLADADGSLTRRMLGSAAACALCVADRFGELFSVQVAPTSTQLPEPATALAWLEYIQIQCPE